MIGDSLQIDICGDDGMRYKLGEICKVVSGSTPKTGISEYWDGDIKWITPAELSDDSYIVNDVRGKLFLQLHGNEFFHCTVSRFFTAW